MIKKSLFSITASLLLLFATPVEAVNMDPGSHLMFSRPQYAKYIDVQCYIINWEQLRAIFNSTKADCIITQLTNNQLLNSNKIYLFVRLRNKSNCPPFGTLHCFVPHVKAPFPVEILSMYSIPGGPFDYAYQLDQTVLDRNDLKPKITWKWHCLYSLSEPTNNP